MHYLPIFDAEKLKKNLLEPTPEFLAEISAGKYERLGLDRALLIASDLMIRTGKCAGLTMLDVGCNSGLIGRALEVLGNNVSGIDNYAVDQQQLYQGLENVEKRDLLEYLQHTAHSWDCVLLLSVAHHWETGYAMQGSALYTPEQIHWIFAELKGRVRYGIYLEMPLTEPGFTAEFTDRFLLEYCRGFGITEINRTVATNGFQRRLFYLAADSKCENILLEKLLRNAHLYEKMEMSRLTVSRAQHFMVESRLQQLAAAENK